MIIEVGHFALLLALAVAAYQMVVPLYAATRGDERLMRVASSSAIVQFSLLGLSFAVLTWAYVTSDFSVLNVWSNSHSAKPLIYKISGVWGNHEGGNGSAERCQYQHPKQHRTFVIAPDTGDLIDQRFGRMRIGPNIEDGKVGCDIGPRENRKGQPQK